MESLRFAFGAGSWWMFIVLAIVASAIAWYSYRTTNPPLSSRDKGLLTVLRAIGLALLLFTLFEPLLRIRQSDTVEPRIAIAIDVSRSMSIKDRSVDRKVVVKDLFTTIRQTLGDRADVFVFDQQVRPFSLGTADSLRLNGYRSDLGKAIRFVGNSTENVRYAAIVLVTDGNYNSGEQPVYVAEKTGLGLYTIGVGDTVAPSDARVVGLYSRGIAIVSQPMPIIVDLEYNGMADGNAEVILKDNNQVVARQQVSLTRGPSSRRVSFTWTPTSDGIHKITTEFVTQQQEFTRSNNIAQSFVRVQKNKRKILLVAGAASPDVTFIKSAIEFDPTVEVVTRIQRDAVSFYEGLIDAAALQDIQAIVLIGYPTAGSSNDALERLAEKAKRTSLLFVPSYQTDYAKLARFQDAVPFTVRSNRAQEILVVPDVSARASADPVMKIRGEESDVDTWNQLPPIYRTELFVEPAQNATILADLKIGSASMDEPLIIKSERGGVRSLAVLGYGLYRWKLLGQGPAVSRGTSFDDVLQSFVGNTIKWLSVRDDDDRVRIRSSHEFYAAGESINFSGSVLDQTLSVVDDAEVVVDVSGASGTSRVVFSSLGGGQYTASVGSLAPGDYAYKGTATRRGVQLGSDNGRFTVGKGSIEESALTLNNGLLQLLAQRTGGAYAPAPDAKSVLEKLKNDSRLRPIIRTSDREHALYHLPWFVAGALAAFSLEWFLRKRKGLV